MDLNSEARSIGWATRNHRNRGKGYGMVGPKSRAGGVKRRNHFTTTEPEVAPSLKSDRPREGQARYAVKVGGKIVMVFASLTQANSYAAGAGGFVVIL